MESEETNEDVVPDSPVEKHGKDKHEKEKDHDSKKNRCKCSHRETTGAIAVHVGLSH